MNHELSCDVGSKFKLVAYLNMPAVTATTKVVPCVVVGALNWFFITTYVNVKWC